MKKIALFLAVLLSGCDPMDMRLTIVNESSHDIFYQVSSDDSFSDSNPLRIIENDTVWHESSMVKRNSETTKAMLGRNGWESFINKKCKDSILRLFVFKKDLLLSDNWESIFKRQFFSQKYNMTIEELEKNDWKIVILDD
jgi:hypothetical protein